LNKKNIAFFTSARSEYGLLKPVIQAFQENNTFNVFVIVAGGHFSKEQGDTINEIIDDKIPVDIEIHNLVESDSITKISESNANLQKEIASYFAKRQMDLLFVLGDRTELISVVSTALFQSIPEGAVDNQVRHAITKMSHLHFTATEEYRKNILLMGEEDWRICVSGEPGLDTIKSIQLLTKDAFCKQYNLPLDKPLILATLHSETISLAINDEYITNTVNWLMDNTNSHILFTAANTDWGGDKINKRLKLLAQQNSRLTFVESLGKRNYYTALSYAQAVIGNSSSGLVEAQSFNVPVINVGNRQKGRLANGNVINVGYEEKEFIAGLKMVLNPDFKKQISGLLNIYGDGKASVRILNFIKQVNWNKLLEKRSIFQ
jgi:GDP/UDP-N,N'-diacetylbacillosamine 2-epimerase (hydrolysing)